MYFLLLIILSVLPVFLLGLFIYNKDKDKESSSLLGKLFWGGIAAVFIACILELIIDLFFPETSSMSLILLFIYCFIGIALCEEGAKLFFLYKISYNHQDFDSLYDMIVYAVFTTLGFACLENILYVLGGGIGTAIIRAIFSIPGHTCFGILMGYHLGLAKINSLNQKEEANKKHLALSLLVPTLFHTFFDFCLFSENVVLILIFLVFVICTFIYCGIKVHQVSKNATNLKYKINFCPQCGRKVTSNYCPICGHQNV